MSAQLSLRFSRSRIASIESWPDGVRIQSDKGTHEYPGCAVFPGFVDAHAHILGLGMKMHTVDISNCHSAEECAQVVGASEANRGDWIVAMGWNQELWDLPEMPDRRVLDAVLPDTPVYLRRIDGHAIWVNSAALRVTGIDENTPDPIGGIVQKRSDGSLSGILIDNALYVVWDKLPVYSEEQERALVLSALTECASQGITEIHDMDVHPRIASLVRGMAENGTLKCRVQTYLSGQNGEWLEAGLLPALGEFQQTIGVKFYADGALGSRGAALLEEYSDEPGNKGLMLITEQELYTKARAAVEQGFHVACHAIGDAANRMVLGVYRRLRNEGIADQNTILRVEHAQTVNALDLPLFHELSVVASVQPIHCTSDASMAEKRLAERCRDAYRWRSILDTTAHLCAGSDFPIESSSVIAGIDAFCNRIPFHGVEAWQAQERITVQEALAAYTSEAHRAADMHYRRGSIAVGFDADCVVLDRDITRCSAADIRETKVVATYCGGQLTYLAEGR